MGLEKNMNPLLLQRPGGCICYLVLVGKKKRNRAFYTNYFQDFIDFTELRPVTFLQNAIQTATQPLTSPTVPVTNTANTNHMQFWLLETLMT